MFDRYTERARRVLFFARYELSAHGGTIIEPTHILLGLLRDPSEGIQAMLLNSNVPIAELRRQLEESVTGGKQMSTSAEVPFGTATKRILTFVEEEADRLPHTRVEPEHLLLALLRENDAGAAAALRTHGITLDAAREYFATAPNIQREDDVDIGISPNPLASAHIVRITDLVRQLGQAEVNSPESRDLIARVDDELMMLQLMIK
jgi:ATP-dependent Clp protease ATP-binding subunit ClpA